VLSLGPSSRALLRHAEPAVPRQTLQNLPEFELCQHLFVHVSLLVLAVTERREPVYSRDRARLIDEKHIDTNMCSLICSGKPTARFDQDRAKRGEPGPQAGAVT